MHFLNLIITQAILFLKLLRIINAIDANIVINITSSKIKKVGSDGTKEENDYIELSNDCFAYEFISRYYPSVFEQCFAEIFHKYIYKQPNFYINKNYYTFIKENYTQFICLIGHRLLIFSKDYEVYLKKDADINFEFSNRINTLVPKEFVQENELLDTITNREMLFYIVLNMTNKIIYEGLDILFDTIFNKEIIYQSQNLTFEKSNPVHNINIDRYSVKYYETFRQYNDLINLDINTVIYDLFKFNLNSKKEICCKINVTPLILEPLFQLVKEKVISFEAGTKTLDKTYKDIKDAVESFCKNYLTSYQFNRNDAAKIEIFFEHYKVLHFFKNRYNLEIKNIEKLFFLLEYINKKICDFQNNLDKDNQKSIEIDYNEKEHSRLFSTFSFYNTSIRSLKEKIGLFNNFTHPNIEELSKILYSLSCDVIKIKKVNQKLIIPFTSLTDFREQDLKLQYTFLNLIAILDHDLKRKIKNFTEPELNFLKYFYITLQDIAFLNQIMMFNYSFKEIRKYSYLASDCKNNMFLNNAIKFYDIIMKSKCEEVNKNTLSNFLKKIKKLKRKTNMQENYKNKRPRNKLE